MKEKRKKIALFELGSPEPSFFSLRWMRHSKWSLTVLKAILKEKYEVMIFSEAVKPVVKWEGEKISLKKEVWGKIKDVEIFGFSVITSTTPKSYAVAKKIREEKPKAIIIMGGDHPTFQPEEALENGADLVVRGEAEPIIMDLMEAIEENSGFEKIPNLSWKTPQGEIIIKPLEIISPDLNSFPYPEPEDIQRVWGAAVPVESSRGCPFNCDYCGVWPKFGRKVRYRDPEKVVEFLKKYFSNWKERIKRKSVFFIDDNFLLNPKRVITLLELMIERKVSVHFVIQASAESIIRADKIPGFFKLYKKAGGGRVFMGVESCQQESLNEFHKKQTITESEEAIRILKQKKIPVHLNLMVGGDSEDEGIFEKTRKFLKRVKPSSIWVATDTPLPGTPFKERLDQAKRIFNKDWGKFDGFHLNYQPLNMRKEVLQIKAVEIMQEFFSLKELVKSLGRREWGNVIPRLYGKHFLRSAKKEAVKYTREFLSLQ